MATRADLKNREFICDFCNFPFIGYKYFGHRTHCPERPKGRGHTAATFRKMKMRAKERNRKPKDGRRKVKHGRRKRTTQGVSLNVAIIAIKGRIKLLSAKTAFLRQQVKAVEQQKTSLTSALKHLNG